MLQCFAAASIRSACRLPPQPSLGHIHRFFWAVQPAVRQALRRQKLPQGHIHRFFWAVEPAVACLIPQPTGTPRPHQWLLMGVQACRLPRLKLLKGLKPLKPLKPFKSFLARPTPQAKATPTGTPGRKTADQSSSLQSHIQDPPNRGGRRHQAASPFYKPNESWSPITGTYAPCYLWKCPHLRI